MAPAAKQPKVQKNNNKQASSINKKKRKKALYFKVKATVKEDVAVKEDIAVKDPFEENKNLKMKDKIPKSVKTIARVPVTPAEASSNWKNLYSLVKPSETTTKHALFLRKKKGLPIKPLEKKSVTKEAKANESEATKDEEVWFDNVDPLLLDLHGEVPSTETKLSLENGSEGLTKALALDCEMVGVGPGGVESALARVSLVNHFGKCVYDKYVKPGEEVTDYRTEFSGIRPHNLINAVDLGTVCHEVSALLRGRILVGHGLRNDLQVLLIKHPKSNIRDTSKYKLFRSLVNGATPSLKRLAHQFLGIEIQSGEHSSVQDAQAAMRLYTMFRQKWETDLDTRRKDRKTKMIKGKKVKLSAKSGQSEKETEEL